ncbi:MAG: hypothetical protein IPP25_13590 [Saprospiraceae bacterium]|nr:hypothetical protein [Candidatus Opimibacter skivensis]
MYCISDYPSGKFLLGPDHTSISEDLVLMLTNENLPNPTIMEGGTCSLVVTNTVTQCVSAPDEVSLMTSLSDNYCNHSGSR